MHGKTDGLVDTLLHPYAKLMTLSPGLAARYATWPGADGHCGGYTIDGDGMLIPPNIQVVAENMRALNERKIHFTSKVRIFTLLYLGRTDKGGVALACVPGWISDYLMAE